MSPFSGTGAVNASASKKWVIGGVSLSLGLHSLLAISYFWTPNLPVVAAPPAAPIPVTIAAPFATNSDSQLDLKEGEKQMATEQVAGTDKLPDPMPTLEKPTVEEEVETPVEPEIEPEVLQPVVAKSKAVIEKEVVEKKRPPEKKPVVKKETVEKPKPQPKKPKVDPKPELKPEPPKPVVEPKAQVKLGNSAKTVTQEASAPQSIATENKSNQTTAPQMGQLSKQQRQAKLTWQQAVRLQLEQEKRYPKKAKRMRKKGMPWVRFTMDRSGKVISAVLYKGSGTTSLDEEAVNLIYRAQPLMKPPPEVKGERVTLTVPIDFRLN